MDASLALRRVEYFDPAQNVAPSLGAWVDAHAVLRCAADVEAVLGEPTRDDQLTGFLFEAPCGLQFGVMTPLPAFDATALLCAASPSEVDHARLHLPFETQVAALGRFEPLPGGWELSRLDDNGQRTVVGCYPRRRSADCVATRLSAGGHKQTYDVRQVGEPPRFEAERGRWAVWRRDERGGASLVCRCWSEESVKVWCGDWSCAERWRGDGRPAAGAPSKRPRPEPRVRVPAAARHERAVGYFERRARVRVTSFRIGPLERIAAEAARVDCCVRRAT